MKLPMSEDGKRLVEILEIKLKELEENLKKEIRSLVKEEKVKNETKNKAK
jgi:hypothetical protein